MEKSSGGAVEMTAHVGVVESVMDIVVVVLDVQ